MIWEEGRKCVCGHMFTVRVNVAGDYDPPDRTPVVSKCEVCQSAPYKKLRDEYNELLRKLP